MTKDQFAINYAHNSGISLDEYNKLFYTAECDCGDDGCDGWKAVSHAQYISRLELSIIRNNSKSEDEIPTPSKNSFELPRKRLEDIMPSESDFMVGMVGKPLRKL